MSVPHRVAWTDHALVKAGLLGVARVDVEAAVLRGHTARRRNVGGAQWRVSSGRLVVLYDHPNGRDETSARVVTLWRER